MMNPGAFGKADGRYIERLMRNTRAPIASRWVSIALRRLFSSRSLPRATSTAPIRRRARLAAAADGRIGWRSRMVQSVDPQDYTPKLYQVAMQAALATGDVGAMCPLANDAVKVSRSRAGCSRARCARRCPRRRPWQPR